MINFKFKKDYRFDFFSDREAWNIFRLTAFGEALGWTLLISGIIISRYVFPGNNTAVTIAGQLHGSLFLAYLGAIIFVSKSLGWSKTKTLIALLASIPPFGTLVFEQIIAHQRRRVKDTRQRSVVVRAIITNQDKLLAVQPAETNNWQLPGGLVTNRQTLQQTLQRLVTEQLGLKPRVGGICFIHENNLGHVPEIHFFFKILNSTAYDQLNLSKICQQNPQIDSLRFVKCSSEIDLQPKFLQTIKPRKIRQQTATAVTYKN